MSDALTSMLENQRAINLANKTRPKRLPVALYPLGIEREYSRVLTQIVNFTRRQILDILVSKLKQIKLEAESVRPDSRTDAYTSTISELIQGIRVRVGEKLGPAVITQIAKTVGRRVSIHNRNQIERQLTTNTLDPSLVVASFQIESYLEPELENFAFWNSRLISSVTEKYIDDVQNITLSGMQTGQSTRSMAKEISSRFGVTKRRAELIARDQVSKLNGQLTQLRHKEAGVKKYRWRTSRDERVRATHAAREGKIYSWNSPPSDGHPGEPINCRCSAEPILEIEDA